MNPQFTRRDFLKLAAMLPLTPLAANMPVLQIGREQSNPTLPNVIFILFDAFSASHLSLYGYPRHTTPNMDRFASRATVYHNHHSAGNFTSPSTASLFTGTYPWTHRAFSLGGLINPAVQPHNIFRLFDGIYNQAAFTQNIYVDLLLYQFEQFLAHHLNLDSFSLVGHTFYDKLFRNDAINGLKSYDEFLFKREQAHGSLLLSLFNDISVLFGANFYAEQMRELHPEGLPRLANTDVYFLNGEVTDGLITLLGELRQPTFTYLHLLPPHAPYMPTSQFLGKFADGWSPAAQKRHRLGARIPQERVDSQRQVYDEFIANIDADFGRLLDSMEQSGLLENSYVILTSDHGEMFEKGVIGHSTALVSEPVIRIPLIISQPGQRQRKDVHALTSNIDLLPSLLTIAGLPIPDWCEGFALPEMGGSTQDDRSIFVVEAKKNNAYEPLTKATTAMIRGAYKLIHYQGYQHYNDNYEFYDLDRDPLELDNLYPDHPAAKIMQDELDQKQAEADHPYI